MQWIPILLVLCNSLAAPFRGLEAVWYQDGIKIRAEYDNFGGVDIDRILTVPGFSSIGFLVKALLKAIVSEISVKSIYCMP